MLEAEISARGIGDMEVLGPTPAFVQRLRGRYRWQLVLRGTEPEIFLGSIDFPSGWAVDIDPMSMVQ